MVDLNTMMRDQARAGLQTQLDAAVTNGDTAAATKIANDIATLAVSSAPKAPPFGHAEITAELDKQAWFGVDPERSALAVDLGKTMDPKKFPTAAAFAEALVKAVDKKLAPPVVAADPKDDDDDPADPKDDDEDDTPVKPKKKTDGPSDGDAAGRSASKGKSGPWVKITDAPPDIQKEVRRQADRFVSSTAPKEQREKFIAKALESHYNAAQRAKGKK
jgi:hypothetical protein